MTEEKSRREFLSEFSIIERFARLTSGTPADVGIGDDGAVLTVEPGKQLVVSMDTLVEGVHFLAGADPAVIGYRTLAVNLSDLAAMGAKPAWVTLALSLPSPESQWVEQFAQGFFSLAKEYSVRLIGGDITRGALTVTAQIHGLIENGTALLRSGAKPGDGIFVTGTLGDAGLGLQLEMQKSTHTNEAEDYLIERWEKPEPRVAAGRKLVGVASACIDVSDGLLADLGHVLDASKMGATLQVDQLPLSEQYRAIVGANEDHKFPDLYTPALSSGDDYELCFTVPEERLVQLSELFSVLPVRFTRIGVVEAAAGIRCVTDDGAQFETVSHGYEHFSG